MAKIVVTIEEIITVLGANGWMSHRVSDMQAVEGGVSFKVDTGVPFVGAVKMQINYTGFDGRCVELELVGGGLLDQFSGLLKQAVKLPEYMRLEYPRIFVDVEQLMGERVKGIAIEGIELAGTSFTVDVKTVA